MSSGSRATRQNLKRMHPVPSDELKPLFVAGYRRCVDTRVKISTAGNLFSCAIERRTGARPSAKTLNRAGDDFGS
jgi:hypothetical protein